MTYDDDPVHGHPVAEASLMDSTLIDTMQSAQGQPRAYRGGNILDSNAHDGEEVPQQIWESAHDSRTPRTPSRPPGEILDSRLLATARGPHLETSDDDSMASESSFHSVRGTAASRQRGQYDSSSLRPRDSAAASRIADTAHEGEAMDWTAPGSIQGRPVSYTGDSLMDSGAPESAQGHPVTYSGGLSTMGTDAGRSARG